MKKPKLLKYLFRYCPKCGSNKLSKPRGTQLECSSCKFHFYLNPGCAVGAFIADPTGRILFVKRAKNPAKGKLGVPGGFIDENETAEEALVREVKEELNLEIQSYEFLCSAVNKYDYREVSYPILDFYFVCTVQTFKRIKAQDEIAAFRFIKPASVKQSSLAFNSLKAAFKSYLKMTHSAKSLLM